MAKVFDCIVVGAGPAGSTAALLLSKAGLRVLLVDKERFPRDKVCADNKTWICTSIVKELGLWKKFQELPKQRITRMLFASPGGHAIELELDKAKIERDGPHYNVRRLVFDNFLFQAAKASAGVTTLENFKVLGAIRHAHKVVGITGRGKKGKEDYFAKVVVGADGSESLFSQSVGIPPITPNRHALSARAYYKGVVHDPQMVELHYLAGVAPGYFWIFPVDGGVCNVGVGMPTLQAREFDLRKLLLKIVSSPQFSGRFKKSRRVSPIGVWGITIPNRRKKICGDGFVLVGDAANTAVAFGGEGVGPAMRSAKFAAKAVVQAFEKQDFSAASLASYEEQLWRVRGPESKGAWALEFFATKPFVFDFIVRRAAKSEKLRRLASSVATDYGNAAKIFAPSNVLELIKPGRSSRK